GAAVLVIPIAKPAPAQQAYLKASNTAAGDSFGYSVAISGDTLVVGARLESTVINRSGDQQMPARLTPSCAEARIGHRRPTSRHPMLDQATPLVVRSRCRAILWSSEPNGTGAV